MKKRSIFGCAAALGTCAYAAYWYLMLNGYIGSSTMSAGAGEAALAGALLSLFRSAFQNFTLLIVIAAVVALFSFMAAFCWGYVVSAGCLIASFTQLPSTASPTADGVWPLWALTVLLITAWVVEHSKNAKPTHQTDAAKQDSDDSAPL